MGKSTISMAMFNSYVKLPEGRLRGTLWYHIQSVLKNPWLDQTHIQWFLAEKISKKCFDKLVKNWNIIKIASGLRPSLASGGSRCFSTIFKQMVDPDPSPKLAMARRLHWNMEKNHPELWKKVEGGDVAICRNPCRKQGSNGSGSFFCFGQCRQLAQPKDNKQYRVERLREEHTFGCFSFVQP